MSLVTESGMAGAPVGHRAPITGLRRVIAERMARSHREIPGVLIAEDCDVTALSLGSLVGSVAHAIGRLAADYPVLNAHLVDDELITFDRCDLGVAVDTARGLMVPVLRDCAARAPEDLQREIGQLATAARAGRLAPSAMRGATTTLTSPGRRGGVFATPLINPPQTAIVGIHRVTPRPVVVDGAVAVRTIGTLTVTFDHRVVDGATAGDYTLALARLIERIASSEEQAPT